MAAGGEHAAAAGTTKRMPPRKRIPRCFRRSIRQRSAASCSGSRSRSVRSTCVMSRVALPRIGSILETRRARIEGDLKEAERLRQETEKAAAAYEAALAEARKNAHGIAEETRASIKADIDNRRADVEAELGKRVTDAEARIPATKDAALANVDDIAAETAQALVAQISGTVTAEEARDAVAAVSKELSADVELWIRRHHRRDHLGHHRAGHLHRDCHVFRHPQDHRQDARRADQEDRVRSERSRSAPRRSQGPARRLCPSSRRSREGSAEHRRRRARRGFPAHGRGQGLRSRR